jgi:hypothetical protein
MKFRKQLLGGTVGLGSDVEASLKLSIQKESLEAVVTG